MNDCCPAVSWGLSPRVALRHVTLICHQGLFYKDDDLVEIIGRWHWWACWVCITYGAVTTLLGSIGGLRSIIIRVWSPHAEVSMASCTLVNVDLWQNIWIPYQPCRLMSQMRSRL